MKRILIIEDGDAIAAIERDYLVLSEFEVDIAASGNLLYNMAVLVREMDGCVLTMQRLDCQFDGLRPVPLSPPLEAGTVLIWKRSPTFSPVTGAFLHFSKSFLTGMKDNEK